LPLVRPPPHPEEDRHQRVYARLRRAMAMRLEGWGGRMVRDARLATLRRAPRHEAGRGRRGFAVHKRPPRRIAKAHDLKIPPRTIDLSKSKTIILSSHPPKGVVARRYEDGAGCGARGLKDVTHPLSARAAAGLRLEALGPPAGSRLTERPR
jgi:hypothetical protein